MFGIPTDLFIQTQKKYIERYNSEYNIKVLLIFYITAKDVVLPLISAFTGVKSCKLKLCFKQATQNVVPVTSLNYRVPEMW